MSLDKEIRKYIVRIEEIYEYFLIYIDDSDVVSEEDYINLIQIIDKYGIQQKKEIFNHFISTVITVSNHHHRQLGFFEKIERILIKYQDIIKQNNTNIEIYKLFDSNKRLLYFLIKEKILTLDEEITQLIKSKQELNGTRFSDFFLKEIDIDYQDNETLKYYSNHLNEYEENRRIGENDSYICSLIRQDSIEEFVNFINRTNYSLSNTIAPSIFETNTFLIRKEITLIEYAAFFGSIQIFQYLYLNKVKVSKSLWLYGIHSNNSDLLRNYIESNHIEPADSKYIEILEECIKCHHNDIAIYIQDNLIDKIKINAMKDRKSIDELVFDKVLKYHNYSFIQNNFDRSCAFFYFYKYHYTEIIVIFAESQKEFIDTTIIKIKCFFLNKVHIKLIF